MTIPGSPRKYSRGAIIAVTILLSLAALGIVASAVLGTLFATGQIGT